MAAKRVIFVILILTLLLVPKAPSVRAESPTALQYYVTDNVGVLNDTEYSAIQSLLFQIENQTSAQVAVYIVNTTSPLSIEQFAVQTFEKSQLGQKGVDNGVLLVVAVNDREWKIEVGYGLEAVLNDAKVGSIGREYLDPAFLSDEYGSGIYNAVYAMGNEIAGSDTSHPSDFPIAGIPLNAWQLVVVAVVIIVLAVVTRGGIFLFVFGIFRRGGGGRSGGGGAKGGW